MHRVMLWSCTDLFDALILPYALRLISDELEVREYKGSFLTLPPQILSP